MADSYKKLVHDAVATSLVIDRLVLGFMGLGLVVGVAALGVIAARSVVERRQQIGVMRAIGFQASAVRLGFLLESGLLAVSSIVVGAALGLAMGLQRRRRRVTPGELRPRAVPRAVDEPRRDLRGRARGRARHDLPAGPPGITRVPGRGAALRVAAGSEAVLRARLPLIVWCREPRLPPDGMHMRTIDRAPLSETELTRVDAYWRAANYLTVGQIYLLDNALLRRPLVPADVKPRLLGHWGTSPGLNLIYAHLDRVIARDDLDCVYVIGPGHGGPAILANTWLEGSYTETYPAITRDAAGMQRLFGQFSFPGGVPSHVAPETPGSIHEGGELGYSLSHAFGAAFDNPDLVVACVVGDGEAETGPLATSWHSNKFLDPCGDGAVLPILHLNGYKIANPTVLARIPERELTDLLVGCGWEPYLVGGDDPASVHQQLAATLDHVLGRDPGDPAPRARRAATRRVRAGR